MASNPCERGGRLYVADRRDKIWTEQESPQLVREESAPLLTKPYLPDKASPGRWQPVKAARREAGAR